MTINKFHRSGIAWSLVLLTTIPCVSAQMPRSSRGPNTSQTDLKSAAAPEQDQQSADAAKEGLAKAKARLALAAAAFDSNQTFDFSGWEVEYRFGDAAVKGAPFSAQVVREDSRILANGVHISHKWTGAIYRDSEGRTRREQPSQAAAEIVMIEDPVGAVSYRLNLIQHTAQKIPYELIQRKMDAEKVARRRSEEDIQKRQEDEGAKKQQLEEALVKARSAAAGLPPGSAVTVNPDGNQAKTFGYAKTELPQKIEQLGKQIMEGVEAEGTRSTITIPAGKEGNDQPFDIVSERWYSADLQMTVMSKHSDPRTGDNVYRLVNVNRSEPPSSLFAPPSDFTVNEVKIEPRRRE